MFPFLSLCRQMHCDFVVRAAQDRCVDLLVAQADTPVPRRSHHKRRPEQPPQQHLFEVVCGWSAQGEQDLDLPATKQSKARTAHLGLSFGAVRLLAPAAVRLWQLRAAARQRPEQLARQTLPADVVEVVAAKAGVSAAQLTTQQCWHTIASCGGYLGRKGDGPPGWKTLWQGWFYIQTLLEGVHLAARLSLDSSSDP